METADPVEGQIRVMGTSERQKRITPNSARIRKTTHKYGIEIPMSLPHACEIDASNGNTFWQDAIRKEMSNIGITLDILENDMKTPSGWNVVTGHIIFDVRIDFMRKAR
eukprot:1872180-Ditylum_brightwellii.AAC.1